MKQALLPFQSPQAPFSSLYEPMQASNNFKVKPIILRDYRVHHLYENNLRKDHRNYSKALDSVQFQISRSKTSWRQGQTGPFSMSSVQNAKNLLKILEAQHPPQRLDCSFYDCSFFQKAYFFSKIRRFTSLLFLQLNFDFFSNQQQPSDIFTKWLYSLKSLSHFQIELHKLNVKTTKILHQLFRCLFSLKKLTSLSLTFASCQNFKSPQLHLLSSYLKKFTKLRALNLRLISIKEIDEKSLENLASSLSCLQGLTKISFHIRGKMPAMGYWLEKDVKFSSILLKVFGSFQRMKSLSDLDLNFSNSRVTYDNNPVLIARGLFHLQQLPIRKLKLTPYEEFGNRDLRETIEILKFYKCLTIVCFDLTACPHVTKNGLAELTLPLTELSSLSSLHFIPRHFYRSTEGIASAIKYLYNLVELKLGLSGKYASDDSQIEKFSSILKDLKSLKYLDLSFEGQESLSDRAMESLSQALKDLVLLQKLKLAFENVPQLTNEGIKCLTDGIQKLKNLKDLSLFLWFHWQPDEKGVELIGQALRCLPCLEVVHFEFHGNFRKVENKRNLLSLSRIIKEKKKNCQVFINPQSY